MPRIQFYAALFFLCCVFFCADPAFSAVLKENIAFEISFERIKSSPSGRDFKIILKQPGISVSFLQAIHVSKGTLGPWQKTNGDRLEATVTVDPEAPTGKYVIDIQTADGQKYRRIPLVMGWTHERWNQAELFDMPVSSDAWEDCPQAFVEKDAFGVETLYLALSYMPIPFECLMGRGKANPKHETCQRVTGPYLPPARPHMTIAPLVGADRVIDQTLPSLLGRGQIGAAKSGTANYIFKFAQDGYPGYLGTPLENPHALYIEDDDGYSIPSGPFVFKNGSTYQVMYHNVQFANTNFLACPGYGPETHQDIYILDNLDLSAEKTVLGKFVRADPGKPLITGKINTGKYPCPELVLNGHVPHQLPTEGVQDNPVVYFPKEGQPVVIWDQEGSHEGDLKMVQLSSGGTFPMGPWNQVTDLPILAAPQKSFWSQPEKTQPILTDNAFCYRVETVIECAPYNGKDPADASSYGPAVMQLGGDDATRGAYHGRIVAAGEPSLFAYQGQNCMSFAVAETVGKDQDVNIDVGWVCEN